MEKTIIREKIDKCCIQEVKITDYFSDFKPKDCLEKQKICKIYNCCYLISWTINQSSSDGIVSLLLFIGENLKLFSVS